MKNFASLIKDRRSTRKFTSQLLNPDQVASILKAALMAPASKRKNPWQFVVVEDKEMLKKLAGCKPHGAAFIEGCALAVVVLANVMESDVWIEDASIVSTLIQLEAESLGLGSCWIQMRNRQGKNDDSETEVRNASIPSSLCAPSKKTRGRISSIRPGQNASYSPFRTASSSIRSSFNERAATNATEAFSV